MLLGLALVFGIVAVIAATSLSADSSKKTYGAVANLQSVITATSRLYGPNQKTSASPYLGLTNSTIGPALDPGMYNAGLIRNAWGGNISVVSTNTYGTAGDSYLIIFTAVPTIACSDFVAKAVGVATTVAVGTQTNYALAAGGAPPTGSQIAAACATGAGTAKYTTVYVANL